MSHFVVWMVVWRCLVFGNGESLCTREMLKSSNVSAELRSDVLLPCIFAPSLLGSDTSADISVVWSQINTSVRDLVEITLQGEEKFWNSKDRRIKLFSKLSESGNFSILLREVQPFDLSLYRCELFNGTSCRIAYQEIQLGLPSVSHQASMITGASIGAILVCVIITSVFYLNKKRKRRPHPDRSHDTCIYENEIYGSYQNPAQLSRNSDEAHIYESLS